MDHFQSCCTVCATVHHRKCEHVVTIDEAVSGVKISSNAQELTKKLIKRSKKIEAIIINRNQNTTNFKNEIDIVLVEIANMRKKLNDKLDKLENEIREQVNSTRQKHLHRQSKESTELPVLENTFDHWKNIFEACLSQGSEIQCLVKMEEISRIMPQFENDLSKVVKEIKNISVEFEATNNVSNIENVDHSIKLESAVGKGFQYNHSNLSDPYNQEIDEEGNIYVVGYSSNNIHQLTPTGELIRIIPLSDIDNTITGCPWVMRFRRNTNRFLLTFHASAGPVLVCGIE
ncbi:unnamed protein product [Mytilus coruscus]|uniref:B box-type domain-containing protein n=1 Tax=Mytilus coruscus TaxID=42192 RepID=A0A6J8AXV0_MYTCO|nr:unnamed protein product [Mytilus coruscus]